MNNFNEFKQQLDSKNTQSWEILKTNISIAVRNWCMKEYFEITWTEFRGSLMNVEEFYEEVYSLFRDKYDSMKEKIDNYVAMKEQFINIASDFLRNGFPGFMKRISQNDESAWKRLDSRIRNLLKGWLAQKGNFSQNKFERIYSETLYVFCENLRKGSLIFENSKKLKSYILRIAELKLKECERQEADGRMLYLDKIHEEWPEIQISHLEIAEQQQKIEKLLETLNYEEKQILYGVYFYEMRLKDIAGILNVSEESCRVKKHRALKKLHDQLTRVPNLTY